MKYAILDKENNIVSYEYYGEEPNPSHIKHYNGLPLVRKVVSVNEEFNPITHVRSPLPVQIEINDTEIIETYELREKNSYEITAMKNAKKQQIKEYAQQLIYNIMPQYKQINTLALGMEMTIQYGPDPNNWPAPIQAINNQTLLAWAAIKDIRIASDIKELEVDDLTTAQEVHDYDITIGWNNQL